jgi:hypothetical protein
MRRLAAYAVAAWLSGREAVADADPAVRLNEEGIAHLRADRSEEAVRAFEAALAARPGAAAVEHNLALALAESAARRPGDAIALLERAVRLHPSRLRYRVLLGCARFEGGDDLQRAAARDDFAFVLERDPDHFEALVRLGRIRYLERDLEEAARLWRHALALRPGDAEVAAWLARAVRERDVESSFAELPATHFLVRHSAEIPVERAQEVLVLCEEARGRLSALYGSYPPRIVVTLYTPEEFQSATDTHGWVAGLSDGTIRLTVRRQTETRALGATIAHELTHHILREIAPRTPVWLHEGLAQLEEGKDAREAEARLRGVPAVPESILSAAVLGQRDPRKAALFYDVALAFTSFLREGQREAIPRLLRELKAGKEEADAFREAFGETREAAFDRWRASAR